MLRYLVLEVLFCFKFLRKLAQLYNLKNPFNLKIRGFLVNLFVQ